MHIQDEWDLLIEEFGLESDPMALPMSRQELRERLLQRKGKTCHSESRTTTSTATQTKSNAA